MRCHVLRWVQQNSAGMDAEHLLRRYGVPVRGRFVARDGSEAGCEVPMQQAVWAEYLLCRAGWTVTTPLLDARHGVLLERAQRGGATRPVGGGRIRRQGFVASYFGFMDEVVGLGERHRERMQPPQTQWKRQAVAPTAARRRASLGDWLKQIFGGG